MARLFNDSGQSAVAVTMGFTSCCVAAKSGWRSVNRHPLECSVFVPPGYSQINRKNFAGVFVLTG